MTQMALGDAFIISKRHHKLAVTLIFATFFSIDLTSHESFAAPLIEGQYLSFIGKNYSVVRHQLAILGWSVWVKDDADDAPINDPRYKEIVCGVGSNFSCSADYERAGSDEILSLELGYNPATKVWKVIDMSFTR